VLTVASGISVTAYCLWAFERPDHSPQLAAASVVPLVLFLLRYALLLDQGRGGTPEDLILADRTLAVLAAGWVALFAGAIYL
jgi:decaprenyl-phosphate phosphoribosyltransferase